MNRRSFFQSLSIAAAALAVDPERLLWTPGKKTIFIPSQAIVAPKHVVQLIWEDGTRTYMAGLDGGVIDVTALGQRSRIRGSIVSP